MRSAFRITKYAFLKLSKVLKNRNVIPETKKTLT